MLQKKKKDWCLPQLNPHLYHNLCWQQLAPSLSSKTLPRWHQQSTAVLVENPPGPVYVGGLFPEITKLCCQTTDVSFQVQTEG